MSYIVKVIEYNGQLCVPIPEEICKEFGIRERTKVSVDVTPDRKSMIIRKIE